MSTHFEDILQHHADADERFQTETRGMYAAIQETLHRVEERMERMEAGQVTMQQDISQIKVDQAPLLELYKGFVFGKKAVTVTAGFVGAMTVIIGGIMATLKYFKP